MDIAEKLIRAKDDYDAVLDKGYQEGRAFGWNIGIEDGKQAEYDRFWDNFQQDGARTYYWGGFCGTGWSDEIFKPKYPLNNVGEHGYMFRDSRITRVPRITITLASIAQIFYGAKLVKWVDGLVFTQETTRFADPFSGAIELEHCPIEGVIGATLNASACPFDKVTITSFVNALSPTKTGQTLTLSLAAVNKAFETQEDWNDGSTSVEWQALISTKPNWTVELA